MPDDAVVAVDVGNNTYSFGRYFEATAQSVLMSGYLGSIGFGFPAAMGAWAAAPDRPIVAVTGDGGLRPVPRRDHHRGEVRDGHHPRPDQQLELGKITKEQRADRDGRVADLTAQPRLRRLRRAVRGARHPGGAGRQLDDALVRALAHEGPALVEVIADPDLV